MCYLREFVVETSDTKTLKLGRVTDIVTQFIRDSPVSPLYSVPGT